MATVTVQHAPPPPPPPLVPTAYTLALSPAEFVAVKQCLGKQNGTHADQGGFDWDMIHSVYCAMERVWTA